MNISLTKFLFFSLFVGFGGVLIGTPVNAASNADNLIKLHEDSLNLRCVDDYYGEYNNQDEDITTNWTNILNPNSTTHNGRNIVRIGNSSSRQHDVWSDLQARISDGTGWAITYDDYRPGQQMVKLIIQNSVSNAYFEPNGTALWSDNSWYVVISCRNSDIRVDYNNSTNSTGKVGIIYESNIQWNGDLVYFINMTIDYPEGYDGIEPPLSAPGVTPQSDSVPSWYVSNAVNWKVSIHDKNFNTFDGNPWLCSPDGNSLVQPDEEGFAPVLYWQIWDDEDGFGTDLKANGYQSATAPIEWQAPKVQVEKEYRIAGWYDCGGDLEFSDAANLTFKINAQGSLQIDLFEQCVTETFPFINIQGCMNNLSTIINLLYFGEVKFPSWTFNPACHNLTLMDDWLGLPNGHQVCPQIPSSVRTVVTPFVAFMLGLVTMGFIRRRSGDFNG